MSSMSPQIFLPQDVRETWEQQIQVLLRCPSDLDTRTILSTMTPDLLLRTSILSEEMFATVTTYLDFLTSGAFDEAEFSDDESSDDESIATEEATVNTLVDSVPFDGPGIDLGGMPPEIALRILTGLNLLDKVRLAQSSRHCANLVAVAVQDEATVILARFHLRFIDVRLLLRATGAIISGSAVLALITSGPPFDPGDLDFFTQHGGSAPIIDFLGVAAGYKQISVTGPYDFAKGVATIRTLRRGRHGQKINVIEGYTDNPLDIVVRFHSTPVFGAWASDFLWHGSAELTVAGIAITTPSQMPLDGSDQCHEHTRDVLRKYTERGFNYYLNEYPHGHTCGVDLRCPATLRSSDDEGCLLVEFPRWDLSAHAFPFTHVSWNMGGGGCSAGVRASSGAPVRPTSSLPDGSWTARMRMILYLNAAESNAAASNA